MAGGQYECIGRVASLDDVEAARHGAAPAAAELLGQVPAAEGRLLPALVAAVEALAERDGDRLEAVGGRLAAHPRAAARGAARRGHDRAPAEPGRRRVDDPEREVASFAARGLTDAEIAARLSLSRRTVQTHLYRVYAKLGVSGRRELAPLFPGPMA
jgi:DNA-binding NarL/FixJ family response regulator